MSQNKYFGDTGLDSLAVGGNNPIFSFLTSAMASGKALADDGKAYDSVQDAENAADSFVLVGPGTFNESVTIDTAGLTLMGAGYGTLIDGGTIGDAVEPSASNITIKNLSLKTAPGGGNSNNGIRSRTGADSLTIDSVTVRDSDRNGITIIHGSEHIISNCVIESADFRGVDVNAPRTIISSVICTSNVSDRHVQNTADDCIVANCISDGSGDVGINNNGNDAIIIGNRSFNSSAREMYTFDTVDAILANNRAGTVDDGGTGTVLDDNRTGGSN